MRPVGRIAAFASHRMNRPQVDVANALRKLRMNEDGVPQASLAAVQHLLHSRDAGGIEYRLAGRLQSGPQFLVLKIPSERFPEIYAKAVKRLDEELVTDRTFLSRISS